MYKVVGRERIKGNRLGKYIVEFNTKWNTGARNIYLISEFTSWFPGHIKLRKIGDRGVAVVKLWEGVYHYLYSINGYEFLVDEENPERIKNYRPYPEVPSLEFTVSVARVGVDELEQALKEGGVHFEHIVHVETDPAFISKYLDYYVVRIKTLKNEFVNIELEYICEDHVGIKVMDKVVSTKYHDFYEALIKCRRLKAYRFILYDSLTNRYVYGDEGVVENPSFILVRSIKGVDKPKWYIGAIYYSIFVDSFHNGDPSNDPPTIIRRYAPREPGYYGGDIRGIIEKLNYLIDLGIEAIYLTPIFRSPSYHRYDVVDYHVVDRYLGTLEDFKELLNKAHSNNIKVVIDLPLHHSSICFKAFREALFKGNKSKYWKWYNFLVEDIGDVEEEVLDVYRKTVMDPECPCRDRVGKVVKGKKLFYETFLGVPCMPKFNYDNMEVVEFFKNVIRHWASIGVDGFRLDVSLGVPEHALNVLYLDYKGMFDDGVFIGEVTGDPLYYMHEETYDSVMNYELRRLILAFFIEDRITATEFALKTLEQYVKLAPYQANSLYNLVGSHDTPRIMTIANGDKRKVLQAYAYLITAYGAPSIYYGDEIGIEGGGDPDNRRPMIWDESKWDKQLLVEMKKLLKLRRKHRVLKLGFYHAQGLDRKVLLVKRWLDDEEALAVFNASDNVAYITISGVTGKYIDQDGNVLEFKGDSRIKLMPRGYIVLVKIV